MDQYYAADMTKSIFFLLLLSLGFYSCFLLLSPDIFSINPDSSIYALSAKSLLAGLGNMSDATTTIYHTYPHLSHMPVLQSLALVPAFALFGVSDYAAFAPNALFYCLSILTLYILAKKLHHSSRTSFLLALLFLANPLYLQLAVGAMSEPLFILLLLLALTQALSRHPRPGLTGLFFGLTTVTKFTGLFLLPLAWLSFPTLRKPLFVVGAFIAFGISWLFPSVQSLADLAHHQLFTYLGYQTIYPPSHGGRGLFPTSYQDILPYWPNILAKSLFNAQTYAPNWLLFPTLLFLLFPVRHPLYRFILLASLIFFIFHSFTEPGVRYLFPFIPLMYLFAQFHRFSTQAILGLALLTLLIQPGLLSQIRRLYSPNYYLPTPIQLISWQTKALIPLDSTLVSNLFAQTAWYADHPTTLFPIHLSDLASLKPDYLLLINQPPFTSLEPEWQALITSPHDQAHLKLVQTFTVAPPDNFYPASASASLYAYSPF